MTNSEMEQVVGKLVSGTDLIADQIAELVKNRAKGIPKADARRMAARAVKIVKAAQELRAAFDQFQSASGEEAAKV